MKRALGRDDPAASGHSGDLECGLVGLGSGVGEENPRLVSASHAGQPFGKRDLGRRGKKIRDMPKSGDLTRYGSQHGGMGMTERVDCQTREQDRKSTRLNS